MLPIEERALTGYAADCALTVWKAPMDWEIFPILRLLLLEVLEGEASITGR